MNTRPATRSGRSRRDTAIVVSLIAGMLAISYQVGRTVGTNVTAAKMGAELERFVQYERSEAETLERAYGPSKHSQHAEEWILKDFFKGQRDGVFVDVGANHHQQFSNTYYLETELGWSGVAIEPQVKFADGYKQYRPRTTFVPLFVSDVSNREATLYVSGTGSDLAASGVRQFTESFSAATKPMPTTTSTLDDILGRAGVRTIDFLSIDIELSEPQALAGFSIDLFRPRLVAIEAHLPVRQQILDYFATHGYVLLGRYWRADEKNFWFAPLGTVSDDAALVSSHSH